MPDLVSKLREPIECLIAYHEQEAKGHVSSQWIYSNHMFAVAAYKKVLTMLDGLERESLLGLEGQAATCDHKRKAFYLGPDGSEFCVCGFKKFGPRSTVEKQPPSTPIVPGTAGLSAEQVQRIVELHHNDGIFLWASMTADLNALLAAKSAEPLEGEWYRGPHGKPLKITRPAPAGEVNHD